MGDLSKNFSRYEFACHCGCGFNAADTELLKVLQTLRDDLDTVIEVTSGCRCHKHNASLNGSTSSFHIKALASDIAVYDYPPDKVADYLEQKYPNKYGIGRYPTHTHVDVRPTRARWGKST